jgi:hypothetical protein
MDIHGTESEGSSTSCGTAHRPATVALSERTPTSSSHNSRGPRHRHVGGNLGRPSARSSTTLGTLGSGAGTKRRLAFGDFFDIGPAGNGKDWFGGGGGGGGGGGKRGRFL